MKKDQLSRSIGHLLRIRPIARRPNVDGELPQIDDDWILKTVESDRLKLSNSRTNHVAVLGLDAIHSFMSDPARDAAGLKHGFLQLRVQLYMWPNGLEIEPLPPGDWGLPSRETLARIDKQVFKPHAVIEGDPLTGRQQYLLLRAGEPFQVSALDYIHGSTLTRQPCQTALQPEQRIPLLHEKLKPLTHPTPQLKEWAIDLVVRLSQGNSEMVLQYPCLLQRFGEKRVLRVTLA